MDTNQKILCAHFLLQVSQHLEEQGKALEHDAWVSMQCGCGGILADAGGNVRDQARRFRVRALSIVPEPRIQLPAVSATTQAEAKVRLRREIQRAMRCCSDCLGAGMAIHCVTCLKPARQMAVNRVADAGTALFEMKLLNEGHRV